MYDPQTVASTLKTILNLGIDPLRNTREFKSLLADHGHYLIKRDREWLVSAIKAPIFQRVWQAFIKGKTTQNKLNGLNEWLSSVEGCRNDTATWVMKSWNLALNLEVSETIVPPPLTISKPHRKTKWVVMVLLAILGMGGVVLNLDVKNNTTSETNITNSSMGNSASIPNKKSLDNSVVEIIEFSLDEAFDDPEKGRQQYDGGLYPPLSKMENEIASTHYLEPSTIPSKEIQAQSPHFQLEEQQSTSSGNMDPLTIERINRYFSPLAKQEGSEKISSLPSTIPLESVIRTQSAQSLPTHLEDSSVVPSPVTSAPPLNTREDILTTIENLPIPQVAPIKSIRSVLANNGKKIFQEETTTQSD